MKKRIIRKIFEIAANILDLSDHRYYGTPYKVLTSYDYMQPFPKKGYNVHVHVCIYIKDKNSSNQSIDCYQ